MPNCLYFNPHEIDPFLSLCFCVLRVTFGDVCAFFFSFWGGWGSSKTRSVFCQIAILSISQQLLGKDHRIWRQPIPDNGPPSQFSSGFRWPENLLDRYWLCFREGTHHSIFRSRSLKAFSKFLDHLCRTRTSTLHCSNSMGSVSQSVYTYNTRFFSQCSGAMQRQQTHCKDNSPFLPSSDFSLQIWITMDYYQA